MARLVPARPLDGVGADAALALALERGLDDGFVILQRRAEGQRGFAVLSPTTGMVYVEAVAGPAAWDADAETWTGPFGRFDPAESAKSACAAWLAGAMSGWSPGRAAPVAVFLDVARAASGHPAPGQGLLFADDLGPGAASRFKAAAAAAGTGPVGIDAVDAAIQRVSPGAAPYAPGFVTEAQRDWRGQGGGNPAGQGGGLRRLAEGAERGARFATLLYDGAGGPWADRLADDVFLPVSPGAPSRRPASAAASAEVGAEVGAEARTEVVGEAGEVSRTQLRMIEHCIESSLGGRQVWIMGIEMNPADVVAPDGMLPAILVGAVEVWAAIPAAKEGKGGFHVRLATDPDALLGYRVVGIESAAPFATFLPIAHLMRAYHDPENGCDGDGILGKFGRWLRTWGHDEQGLEGVDMKLHAK